MTEVYVFDRGEAALTDELMRYLPPWRRGQAERLRYPPARQESLSAGVLLGYVMEKHGISRMEPVEILPAGKPVFSALDVHFSLSHSGRYAMCALGDGPVGVDVQQIRKVNLTVARRFHLRERDWLSQQQPEEQLDAFFRLWARKEAWVKAESRERTLTLSETDVMHRLPGWCFRDYALPFGFRAAVCAREGACIQELVLLTKETLLEELSSKQSAYTKLKGEQI